MDVEQGRNMGNPTEVEWNLNKLKLGFDSEVKLFEKNFIKDEILDIIDKNVDSR